MTKPTAHTPPRPRTPCRLSSGEQPQYPAADFRLSAAPSPNSLRALTWAEVAPARWTGMRRQRRRRRRRLGRSARLQQARQLVELAAAAAWDGRAEVHADVAELDVAMEVKRASWAPGGFCVGRQEHQRARVRSRKARPDDDSGSRAEAESWLAATFGRSMKLTNVMSLENSTYKLAVGRQASKVLRR